MVMPASAQDSRPIRVGFVSSMSGPVAFYGEQAVQALQLALEEINGSGGILGRRVELVVRDSEAKPTTAVTMTRELISNVKIDALIGPQWSSDSLAVRPLVTDAKIVSLFQSGSDALSDVSKHPYGFRTFHTNPPTVRFMATYAIETLKAKNVGYITDTSEAGRNTLKEVQRVFEERKVPLRGVETYALNSPDMVTQLTKLREAGVETLLAFPISSGDAGRLLRDMATLGWKVPLVGNQQFGTKEALALAKDALHDKIQIVAWRNLTFSDSEGPPARVQRFLDAMKRKYGEIKYGLYYMTQSYDALYILKFGMEAAGSTEGPKVAAALEAKLKAWPGVQSPYTASPESHDMVNVDSFTMASPLGQTPEGLQKRLPGAP
jgi:branched-chain amino acid transport system substrate-binding protein